MTLLKRLGSSVTLLLRALPAAAFTCFAPIAGAWEKIELAPSKDNTLYETPIDQEGQQLELSNGAGNFLFSGRTGFDAGFKLRRALLQFDLESALPSGATILAVELTLYQSRSAPGSPPVVIGLHRALQEWGEAGSKAIAAEGQGDFPEPGDATWHHRLYPDDLWGTAGGQFTGTSSAVTTVGEELTYFTWLCSAGLLSDVQLWQQDPASNFGWVLAGDEESGVNARRFNSRENADPLLRPKLTLYYALEATIFESGFEQPFSCP